MMVTNTSIWYCLEQYILIMGFRRGRWVRGLTKTGYLCLVSLRDWSCYFQDVVIEQGMINSLSEPNSLKRLWVSEISVFFLLGRFTEFYEHSSQKTTPVLAFVPEYPPSTYRQIPIFPVLIGSASVWVIIFQSQSKLILQHITSLFGIALWSYVNSWRSFSSSLTAISEYSNFIDEKTEA